MSLPENKLFRIVSENGLATTARVFHGDEEIKCISRIEIDINAENDPITATFTVLQPKLDICIMDENVAKQAEKLLA